MELSAGLCAISYYSKWCMFARAVSGSQSMTVCTVKMWARIHWCELGIIMIVIESLDVVDIHMYGYTSSDWIVIWQSMKVKCIRNPQHRRCNVMWLNGHRRLRGAQCYFYYSQWCMLARWLSDDSPIQLWQWNVGKGTQTRSCLTTSLKPIADVGMFTCNPLQWKQHCRHCQRELWGGYLKCCAARYKALHIANVVLCALQARTKTLN
jgi:hypothetical protein